MIQTFPHSFQFESFGKDHSVVSRCEIAKYIGGCDSVTDSDDLEKCFDLSAPKLKCPEANGYLHTMNYSGPFWSLAQDKEWICDKAVLAANVYSAQTFGFIIFTLILMQLSDK